MAVDERADTDRSGRDPRAQLPVQDDAVLVTKDFGSVPRVDEEVIARATGVGPTPPVALVNPGDG